MFLTVFKHSGERDSLMTASSIDYLAVSFAARENLTSRTPSS